MRSQGSYLLTDSSSFVLIPGILLGEPDLKLHKGLLLDRKYCLTSHLGSKTALIYSPLATCDNLIKIKLKSSVAQAICHMYHSRMWLMVTKIVQIKNILSSLIILFDTDDLEQDKERQYGSFIVVI